MLKHSLFISLSVGKYDKRNCQAKYRDYHKADKQTKLKKRKRGSQKNERYYCDSARHML